MTNGAGTLEGTCSYTTGDGAPAKQIVQAGFEHGLFTEGPEFNGQCSIAATFRTGFGSATVLGADVPNLIGSTCENTAGWESLAEHIGHDADSIAEYCTNFVPDTSAMAALATYSAGEIIINAKRGQFATMMPGLADTLFIVTSKPEYGECLFAGGSEFGVAICTCDTAACNNQAALELIVDPDVGPMRLLQFLDGSLADLKDAINSVVSDLMDADGKINPDAVAQVTQANVDAIMLLEGVAAKTNTEELWGLVQDYQVLLESIAAADGSVTSTTQTFTSTTATATSTTDTLTSSTVTDTRTATSTTETVTSTTATATSTTVTATSTTATATSTSETLTSTSNTVTRATSIATATLTSATATPEDVAATSVPATTDVADTTTGANAGGEEVESVMSVKSDGICAVVNTAATRLNIKNAHLEILVAAGVTLNGIGDFEVKCIDGAEGIERRRRRRQQVRGRRDSGSASSEFVSEVILTLPEGTTEVELDAVVTTAVEEGVSIEIVDTAGNTETVQVHSVAASTAVANGDAEQQGGSNSGWNAGVVAGSVSATLIVCALAAVLAVLYVKHTAGSRDITPQSSREATVENANGFNTRRRSSSVARRRSSYAKLEEAGETAVAVPMIDAVSLTSSEFQLTEDGSSIRAASVRRVNPLVSDAELAGVADRIISMSIDGAPVEQDAADQIISMGIDGAPDAYYVDVTDAATTSSTSTSFVHP